VVVSDEKKDEKEEESGLSRSDNVRLYDMFITYDKYYRTPKIFIKGIDLK